MDPDARRTRIAVSAAFAAQGLGFAVLLTHLPAFQDKYDVGDLFVTIILFAVSVLAGGGTALATWLGARRGSGLALRLGLATIGVALAVIACRPAAPAVRRLRDLRRRCRRRGRHEEHAGRRPRAPLRAQHPDVVPQRWSAAGIVGALYTSATKAPDSLTPVLLGAAAVILADRGGRRSADWPR